MERSRRWLVVIGSTMATTIAIAGLAPIMGAGATSISFIPAAVAGAMLGLRRGVTVAAACAILTQAALLVLFGRPPAGVDILYVAIHLSMGGAFGWLHDVRERLRESAARSRTLFDQNPLPVMVVDLETQRFLDVNQAAIRHYGYTREQWVGMSAVDLRPPEDRRDFDRARREVRDRQITVSTRHKKRDGSIIDVIVTASPLKLDGRDVVYAIAEDVTERRALEATARRNDRLSALGTLVAGVAHEINNPLTYMQGNVELAELSLADVARDADLPERVRGDLDQAIESQRAVLRGIEQIARITKSLKQIARRSESHAEEIDLDALVRETLDVARTRMASSVDVQADLASTTQIRAVPGEMSQVFLNLLFNAADAVRGIKEPRIHIRTRREGGNVVLEVQDNGEGLSELASAKLFVPFFTTKPEGTGLGLSISQRIVADHGGSIAVDSRPGQGATFRVTLPARAVAPLAHG